MRTTNSIIGSGTVPYTVGIRPGVVPNRGTEPAKGIRDGMNVVMVNPEDLNSSPFFAASGASLTGNQVYELSQLTSLRRSVFIRNEGPDVIWVRPDGFAGSGYPVPTGTEKELPVLGNVQLYVKAGGAGAEVHWMEF